MKKYEIMYILKPELDAEQIKTVNSGLQKILESNGAKVEDINEWGLRDLAYEIKKVRKGYYVVVKLNAPDTKAIDEFNRLARIDVNVLRYLITVTE